jgi:hypothetical protein
MAMPEVSAEQKARDERAFEQSRREAAADSARRQAEAKQFQEARVPRSDVRAGERRLD